MPPRLSCRANRCGTDRTMRWLLQRAENADDVPKLLKLDDSADEETSTSGGLASLPGGTLSITVRSATEARETLAELQRIQQELPTARARTAADGIASLGSNVTRRIQRPSRHLRRKGPQRVGSLVDFDRPRLSTASGMHRPSHSTVLMQHCSSRNRRVTLMTHSSWSARRSKPSAISSPSSTSAILTSISNSSGA